MIFFWQIISNNHHGPWPCSNHFLSGFHVVSHYHRPSQAQIYRLGHSNIPKTFNSWGSISEDPAFILSISSFRMACFQARLNSWYSLDSISSNARWSRDFPSMYSLLTMGKNRRVTRYRFISQPKWKMALHFVDLLWSIVYTCRYLGTFQFSATSFSLNMRVLIFGCRIVYQRVADN